MYQRIIWFFVLASKYNFTIVGATVQSGLLHLHKCSCKLIRERGRHPWWRQGKEIELVATVKKSKE